MGRREALRAGRVPSARVGGNGIWRTLRRNRLTFAPARPPSPKYLHDDRVTTVEPALITPFETGPTRLLDAPITWVRGAVHDATGKLLPQSQRYGGVAGDHVVAVDPTTVAVPDPAATELAGTWLYGGHWMMQFGHFVTETLTTLWPTDLTIDGVLFHPFVFGRRVPDTAELELAALAGYPQPPRIVDRSLLVERLLVPTRPYTVNAAATSQAAAVWGRVAGAVGEPGTTVPGRGIFLSRSRFHAQHARRTGMPHKRALGNEEALDDLFARRGLRVVDTQELPVREQVAVARAASTLVAVSGSALHLSAFARPGSRVVEIGDPRSPHGLPNQSVVDAAAGHQSAVVPYSGPPFGGAARPTLDLGRIARALDDLGV